MQGNVIVCSFGRMGRMVCRELAAKPMPFVVVERDEGEVRRAEDERCAVVLGDATDEDALKRAGILRAAALVAAVPSDAENVFITLTARALRPDMVVVARAETESGEVRCRRQRRHRSSFVHSRNRHEATIRLIPPSVCA